MSKLSKEHLDILKKITILLVDDNEGIRKKLKDILEFYVDDILEASNGLEAFEIYKSKNPTIVITDVKMPVMSGLELTKSIREVDINTPIVIISAYSEKETLLDFISLNLIQYLVKPVDFDELKSVLYSCAKAILKNGLVEFQIAQNASYSFSKKSLFVDGDLVSLSPKEMELIELLIKNKNNLVTKYQIESQIYGGDSMSQAALNNLVLKIRKKIGVTNVIKTVSNSGFILVK